MTIRAGADFSNRSCKTRFGDPALNANARIVHEQVKRESALEKLRSASAYRIEISQLHCKTLDLLIARLLTKLFDDRLTLGPGTASDEDLHPHGRQFARRLFSDSGVGSGHDGYSIGCFYVCGAFHLCRFLRSTRLTPGLFRLE